MKRFAHIAGTLLLAGMIGVGCTPKTEPATPAPAPGSAMDAPGAPTADPAATEDVTPPAEGAPETGAPAADPAVPLSGDPVTPLPNSGDPSADLGTSDTAAAATTAGAVSANHQQLIGTSWQVDDVTAKFTDASKIQLSGPMFGEAGTTADYTIDEQGNLQVTLSSLGITQQGTWDGAKLIIDGKEAEKK